MREETSIILFGLTGQGKSSIANMLIKGDIKNDNSFNINDAVKGAGVQIQGYQNVNFIVYDTVGVGEPSTGTVPHMKAVKEIRNYFSKCEVPLNYIAFVKKKGRFTEEDRKMFNLFKEIFEGSENNFIIIITHSSKFWVDENIVDLRNNFGNYPIIPVDFPFEDPPEDDDDVIIHQRKRAQSDIYHKKDNSFKINNTVIGESLQTQLCETDKFIVYDTIGVGEPSTGAVPHKEAVKKIRNNFSKCETPLNYIAFVKKKSRFTEEDRKMFNLFKEIFEGGENNFIIIITHSGKFWVDENIVDLRNNFGDYPIIPVDFPFEDPPEDDDDVIIHQRKRAQ
ncbi:8921_t:CDS:2, partial [Funneliformis geosporum]